MTTINKRILWKAREQEPEIMERLDQIVCEHITLIAQLSKNRNTDNVCNQLLEKQIDNLVVERESIISYLLFTYDDIDYSK